MSAVIATTGCDMIALAETWLGSSLKSMVPWANSGGGVSSARGRGDEKRSALRGLGADVANIFIQVSGSQSLQPPCQRWAG
jgi:hypothetical protein